MSPTIRLKPTMYRAAVVDLIKNQTRRLMNPQPQGEGWEPQPGPCYSYAPAIECKDGMLDAGPGVYGIATEDAGWIATYGPPGTILPVVTTWAVNRCLDHKKPSELFEPATLWWDDGTPKPEWAGKSRPAMFFPKHLYPLARQAKVVSVKAEPVQSISEEDAVAEGITRRPSERWTDRLVYLDYSYHGTPDDLNDREWFQRSRDSFRTLWDSINAERGKGALKGQYAWKRNPWVFATTFEVLPAE